MALKDIFSRSRKPLDGPEAGAAGDGVSPIASELDGNTETRKKQRMLLAGVGAVGLVASSFWIFGGDDGAKTVDPDKPEQVKVSVSDMANKTLSEQEWMALSENRFQSAENQLKSVDGTNARVAQLSQQLDAMRAQNQSMTADGQRVLSAYQAENEQLRRQVNERAAAPPPVPAGPQAMYGPGSAAVYGRGAGAPPAGPDLSAPRLSEVKMVSFSSTDRGTASKIAKGSTVYTGAKALIFRAAQMAAKVAAEPTQILKRVRRERTVASWGMADRPTSGTMVAGRPEITAVRRQTLRPAARTTMRRLHAPDKPLSVYFERQLFTHETGRSSSISPCASGRSD